MTRNRAAVVALLIGLFIGAGGGWFVGRRSVERDMAAVGLIGAVGRISTATTALRLIEQQQVSKATRLNETMFRSSVTDAFRYSSHALPPMPPPGPSVRRALAEAEAYAEGRNWVRSVERIRKIQQVLKVSARPRT